MSGSISPFPAIARGLLALSIFSGGALADDAAIPQPHWSGLPIWGAEAEARGYQIPFRLGSAITAYSARQPVNIQDLQLGRNGRPVSVKNFLQINQVDTSQQNVSAKFDVLIFPFLDVYVLARIHDGNYQGTHPGSRRSHPGHHRAQGTSAQCRVQWPDLRRGRNPPRGWQGQRLAGPDCHRGGRLEPHQDEAVVRKRNVDRRHEAGGDGLLGQGGPARHRRHLHGRGGLDRCDASEHPAEVAGSVANTDLQFIVVQSPTKPWNTLLGGLFEFGKDGYVLLEGGLGARTSILAAAVYRF